MSKLKKPLIKDYCEPSIFSTPDNNLICFNSKDYARAASKYIEQLETEKTELITALKDLLEAEDNGVDNYIKASCNAGKILKLTTPA